MHLTQDIRYHQPLVDPYLQINQYKNISATTKTNYRYYFNLLRRMCKYEFGDDIKAEEEQFAMLANDMQRTLETMQKYFQGKGVFRNILICLCKYFHTLKLEDQHTFYSKTMLSLCEEYTAIRNKNEMNNKERANWVDFNCLKDYLDEKIKEVECLETLSKPPNEAKLKKKIQETLVLACYILIPPVRNDWHRCKFRAFDTQKDNFIDFEKNIFILNRYKTDKIYGQLEIALPSPLQYLLNKHYTANLKSSDSNYLFQPFHSKQKTNQKFTASNFGKYLVRINRKKFKDKNVNIQMLRKIYSSSEAFQTVEKTKQVAKAMGHSFQQHFLYKRKSDVDDKEKEILTYLNHPQNQSRLFFGDDQWQFQK